VGPVPSWMVYVSGCLRTIKDYGVESRAYMSVLQLIGCVVGRRATA
jgi:hypothetical protein